MPFDESSLRRTINGSRLHFEEEDNDGPSVESQEGLTDADVHDKYHGYLESAEHHRGQPVLMVSRDVTNFLKTGPGDWHRHMGIKTDIRMGIVKEDFKADPDDLEAILTNPIHVSELYSGLFEHNRPLNISVYDAKDSFRFISDRFSRIDDNPKPCFEIVFGADNIANWFNGDDEDSKIIYGEKDYAERVSEVRHEDHITYIKMAAALGFEPVMTEAIKLSFERRREAIILQLSRIAVSASKTKIDKKLKNFKDVSLPKTAESLRRESQEIGITESELVGYVTNELSKGIHVALDE